MQKAAVILFFYMEQAELARFLLRKKVKGDERYGKHNSASHAVSWQKGVLHSASMIIGDLAKGCGSVLPVSGPESAGLCRSALFEDRKQQGCMDHTG